MSFCCFCFAAGGSSSCVREGGGRPLVADDATRKLDLSVRSSSLLSLSLTLPRPSNHPNNRKTKKTDLRRRPNRARLPLPAAQRRAARRAWRAHIGHVCIFLLRHVRGPGGVPRLRQRHDGCAQGQLRGQERGWCWCVGRRARGDDDGGHGGWGGGGAADGLRRDGSSVMEKNESSLRDEHHFFLELLCL